MGVSVCKPVTELSQNAECIITTINYDIFLSSDYSVTLKFKFHVQTHSIIPNIIIHSKILSYTIKLTVIELPICAV